MNPLFSGYAIVLFQLNELKIMCRSENTWKRWEILLLGLSEVCWGDPNKSAFERSQEPIQCRCKQKNIRTARQRGSSFYIIILLHFFAREVWCQIQLEDTESCRFPWSAQGKCSIWKRLAGIVYCLLSNLYLWRWYFALSVQNTAFLCVFIDWFC